MDTEHIMNDTPFISDDHNATVPDSAAAGTTPIATQAGTNSDETHSADFADDQNRTAAAAQNQAAAHYTAEAARNGYPTGDAALRTGTPYTAYPGYDAPWNVTTPHQRTIVMRDKKGPNAPTIVWGALVTLCGIAGLCIVLAGDMFTREAWIGVGATCILALALILIVCAVVAGVKGRGKDEGKPEA